MKGSSVEIKFKDIKPGMVIESNFIYGLVIHIKKAGKIDSFYGKDPCVKYFDLYDPMILYSPYDDEEEVKVITGEKRKEIMKKAARELRKIIMMHQDDLQLFETLDQMTKEQNEE